MEKKNIIRLIIQIVIGLIIAVGVMTSQGAFAEGVSGRLYPGNWQWLFCHCTVIYKLWSSCLDIHYWCGFDIFSPFCNSAKGAHFL